MPLISAPRQYWPPPSTHALSMPSPEPLDEAISQSPARPIALTNNSYPSSHYCASVSPTINHMEDTQTRQRQFNGILAIITGVAVPLAAIAYIAAGELTRGVGGAVAAASWVASLVFLMRS